MSAELWVYAVFAFLLCLLLVGYGTWRAWDGLLAPRVCKVCGRRFRGRNGGGISGSVFCSDDCYAASWAEWMKR